MDLVEFFLWLFGKLKFTHVEVVLSSHGGGHEAPGLSHDSCRVFDDEMVFLVFFDVGPVDVDIQQYAETWNN